MGRLASFVLAVAGFTLFASPARAVELAADGAARFPVVVSPAAGEATREAAAELAEYLGRMSGAGFEIQERERSGAGIAVGVFSEFGDAPFADRFAPADPLRREEYVLESHPGGLRLVAATGEAVSHAVWDLLHRLGHRQFFPHPHWEIVPRRGRLAIRVDTFEAPDFARRWLWNGGGYFRYDEAAHEAWYRRNRAVKGVRVPSGHVYDKIVRERREAFEAHPEYLALVDGQRQSIESNGNKLCLANPALRELVVEWAVAKVKRRPEIDGVSMEPSDGGGWCECEPCGQMGSVSDRVITMASEVATALEARFERPRYVGVLAYSEHSPPPTVDAHPNVIVSVAKGYLRGGWTYEELIEHWSQRAKLLGTYDYLGVVQWSWDRPGVGRATRRSHPREVIPWMHANGVRLYTGESEANWGAAGLGYYLIGRVLWDVDEAKRIDGLVEDFFARAFGPAEPPMRDFYRMIDGDRRPLFSRDLLGRMYRALAEARELARDEAIRHRVGDLVVYTRYAELYLDYLQADGEDRQARFEAVMRYVWRIRGRMMIHAREIYRQLPTYARGLELPEDAGYRVAEAKNPWKETTPVSASELAAWVARGIERNPVVGFERVEYDPATLVPAAPLALDEVAFPGTFGGGAQSYQSLYTWVDDAPAEVALTVTGGLIRHYRDRGDVRVKLLRVGGGRGPADTARVPPDGEPRDLALATKAPDLHRIELTDGGDRSLIEWPDGTPMTLWADAASRVRYPLAWTLRLYVPRGTERIGGYADHPSGRLIDPDGHDAYDFTERGRGFFDVPVGPGQDGRLWTFHRCKGQRLLMTVPPALARNASELLLPRAVVEGDRGAGEQVRGFKY